MVCGEVRFLVCGVVSYDIRTREPCYVAVSACNTLLLGKCILSLAQLDGHLFQKLLHAAVLVCVEE